MGRPTKYTPEVLRALVDALRVGATIEIACGSAGISEGQFYEWQNKKPEFAEIVKAAKGRGAKRWLDVIEHAANDGNWTAAAWKLERRYREDFGRQAVDLRHSADDSFTQALRALGEAAIAREKKGKDRGKE